MEHRDLVPNYEVVELTHRLTDHHSIHKRSINSDNLLSKNKVSSVSDNSDSSRSKVLSKNNHHVKKDLSKVAKFRDYDLKRVQQHQVSFNAFGEHVNLTLKPTQGLFRDGPNLLKMWHVRPDANASQGLFYERIEEVSAGDGKVLAMRNPSPINRVDKRRCHGEKVASAIITSNLFAHAVNANYQSISRVSYFSGFTFTLAERNHVRVACFSRCFLPPCIPAGELTLRVKAIENCIKDDLFHFHSTPSPSTSETIEWRIAGHIQWQ